VGIPLIPVLYLLLVLFLLFGTVAVYCFVGRQLGRWFHVAAVEAPFIALLAGALVITIFYTIPLLGCLVWCIITPLGIGAALWAAFGGKSAAEAEIVPVSASGSVSSYSPPLSTATVEAPVSAPPPALVNEAATLPRAGFWIRFLATLIDWLVVGLASLIVPIPSAFIILWLAYHICLWNWRGTTIGGIVLSLKVARLDGQAMNVEVAVIRCFSGFLSAMPCFLGFFWVGWDMQQQSWHDKIAGTTIVKVPYRLSL